MNIGHITGGTHAGWRKVSPPKKPWTCVCGRENAAYNANCPNCYAPRGQNG